MNKENKQFNKEINKDVIKADLDFKVAFFESRNAVAAAYADTNQRLTDNQNDRRIYSKPIILNTNGAANKMNSAGVSDSLEPLAIADMMNKIIDNGVDLLKLDLELVGDPDWVQQDNVLYGDNVPLGQKTLSNGTINYQGSATYIRFTFKTPVEDYDSNTGLMNVKNQQTILFSGIYQVLKVTSTFRKGRFNQKLECVRVRLQTEKELTNKPAATATNPTPSQTQDTAPPSSTNSIANTANNRLTIWDQLNNIQNGTTR